MHTRNERASTAQLHTEMKNWEGGVMIVVSSSIYNYGEKAYIEIKALQGVSGCEVYSYNGTCTFSGNTGQLVVERWG